MYKRFMYGRHAFKQRGCLNSEYGTKKKKILQSTSVMSVHLQTSLFKWIDRFYSFLHSHSQNYTYVISWQLILL